MVTKCVKLNFLHKTVCALANNEQINALCNSYVTMLYTVLKML